MIHVCAAEHARHTEPVSSTYEYCSVFLVVSVRTRSRADGARGGEPGEVTILCVRTVVLQRRSGLVACSASCNLALSFHDWSTTEGTTKYQNMGLVLLCFLLISSCRTKGPFSILFFKKRHLEFRYEPATRYRTTFNDSTYLVGSCQLELLGICWNLVQ